MVIVYFIVITLQLYKYLVIEILFRGWAGKTMDCLSLFYFMYLSNLFWRLENNIF